MSSNKDSGATTDRRDNLKSSHGSQLLILNHTVSLYINTFYLGENYQQT